MPAQLNTLTGKMVEIATAAPCNAAFNTSWVNMSGCTALLIRHVFTRAAATGNFDLLLQWTPDEGSNVLSLDTMTSAVAYTQVATTLRAATFNASFDITYITPNIIPPFGHCRLRLAATLTSANASDVATIYAAPIDVLRSY